MKSTNTKTKKAPHWQTYLWEHRVIQAHHCVGMRGNLDTIHDALVIVSQHTHDGKEACEVAEWIVKQHNEQFKDTIRDLAQMPT